MESIYLLFILTAALLLAITIKFLQDQGFVDRLFNKSIYNSQSRVATSMLRSGIEFVGVFNTTERLYQCVKYGPSNFIYFTIVRNIHNRQPGRGFRHSAIVATDNDIYAFRIPADKAFELGVPTSKKNTDNLRLLLAEYVLLNYGGSFGYSLTTLHSCETTLEGVTSVIVEKIDSYHDELTGHVVSAFHSNDKNDPPNHFNYEGYLSSTKHRLMYKLFFTKKDNRFLSTLERNILAIDFDTRDGAWDNNFRVAKCKIVGYIDPNFLKPFSQ